MKDPISLQWTPKEVSSWGREEVGQNIFKEEEEILRLLLHILSKRGVKYEESNLKRLLIWCRGSGFPADLLGIFQIETWEKVGTVLWKAASHSEKYILGLVTTWKLIITTVKQIKPEKTVTSISDSKLKVELWHDIEQKSWEKVSNGDKEPKSLVTTWKLIITALKDLKAERSAAAGIFAALQPDKYPENRCEVYPVRVFDTFPTPSPAVLSAPLIAQQSGTGEGKMPSGWPPVPLPNTGENSNSRGSESDNLPKEPVKAENAKVVNKCTISPFTHLYLPLRSFNPPTSTREQKESLDKNWTTELCDRLDQLIASESNSWQCSHGDRDGKGGAPGGSGYTNNYDARKYWRECALF
ncbi:uncharacterized protein [Patagioenas fasciata]|uniref:uncharacterized protein n=1 Tax=Patagioenas fasciata TaxID=372321 RepID=UPI003A99C829